MALVSNIKGYINGNEWGVHEPAPSLLTYEEIIAMTFDEAYAELSSNTEAYYNQLTNSGNLIYKSDGNIGYYLGNGTYAYDRLRAEHGVSPYVSAMSFPGKQLFYYNGVRYKWIDNSPAPRDK